MGKAKARTPFKKFKLKGPKPREYAYMVWGAVIMLIGITMINAIKAKPTPLAPQVSGISSPWIPDSVKKWDPIIRQMSAKYKLDPNFIAIIITIESGGNPKAKSGVGAQGLMQVMPATATDIAAKHLKKPVSKYDIYDPKTNIEFGTAYLAYLRDEFGEPSQGPRWDQTAELVAAGYNGGPGAAGNMYKGLGIESLETLSYSRDVYNMWRERNAPTSPTFNRWVERGGSSLLDAAK